MTPGRFLFPGEQEHRQGQRDDGHRGADRQVDSEVHVFHHEIGDQQQPDSHRAGEQVVLADVRALAHDAAEVRHAEGDESDGAADAHGRGYEEHDHRQGDRLAPRRQLDLAVEVARQVAVRAERGG